MNTLQSNAVSIGLQLAMKQLAGNSSFSSELQQALVDLQRHCEAWIAAEREGRYPLHVRGFELLATAASERCLALL